MPDNVIYGTGFKRSNPKADRAFWIWTAEVALDVSDIIELTREVFEGQDTFLGPPPKDRA